MIELFHSSYCHSFILYEILSYLDKESLEEVSVASPLFFFHSTRLHLLRKHNYPPLLSSHYISYYPERPKILLASYPRSGNSLTRKWIELVTNQISGSDTNPRRPLGKKLIEMGFEGEGLLDRSVLFVKTHFPERSGFQPFMGNKGVVLVRNPFDALLSYFHMAFTQSHDKTLSDSSFNLLLDVFSMMMSHEINIWRSFIHYYLKLHQMGFPVLFVRFEDMISNPKNELRRILHFSYHLQSPLMKDLNYQRCCDEGDGLIKSELDQILEMEGRRSFEKLEEIFGSDCMDNEEEEESKLDGDNETNDNKMESHNYKNMIHTYDQRPLQEEEDEKETELEKGNWLDQKNLSSKIFPKELVDEMISSHPDTLRIMSYFGYFMNEGKDEEEVILNIQYPLDLVWHSEDEIKVQSCFDSLLETLDSSSLRSTPIFHTISSPNSNNNDVYEDELGRKGFFVSRSSLIRAFNDIFGRNVFMLRQSYTNKDLNPFECKEKIKKG